MNQTGLNLHLWLIPLLPLAGAAINGLFGRRFSNKTVSAVALLFPGAALVYALYIAARFAGVPESALPHSEALAAWIRSGSFAIDFSFYLDQLSLVMTLVVTGVGFLIHIYSVGYMAHEGGYYRYFSYLNLFMFFMLMLVLGGNYLVMFVGWEGVGLASYLLIGFFFQRDSAASAGKKAFIVNRIGDFGFLIGLFLLIKYFGSLSFDEVFRRTASLPVESGGSGILTAIGLLLMVGACGKSAQVPLYVWLPDAMEGPTPVSALIHAATMVTAGVYMVCRSNVIYSHAPTALLVVAIIGCLTSFFAATIGLAQTDIKRVLAYSTISQLGYMFLAAGVAAYSASIFHLVTHAFFKALLFLGAGSVIHAVGGQQDMRQMGGLRKYIPYTFWTMLIATCAITGIPGLAGFFSKDEILWQAYSSPYGHWLLWLAGVVTAFLTSFYMFRLLFLTFFGEYRGAAANADAHGSGGEHDHGEHGPVLPHESPWVMLGPLVVLAVLSVVGGYIGVPHVLGGSNHVGHFLAPVMPGPEAQSGEGSSLELALTGVSVLVALAGLGLAWLFYIKRRDLPGKVSAALGGLYQAVLNKYYVDELYGAVFVRPLIEGSTKLLWRGIDGFLIDGAIDNGARGAQEVSDGFRHMQSGNIRSYAGWVVAGAAIVIAYMIWMGAR